MPLNIELLDSVASELRQRQILNPNSQPGYVYVLIDGDETHTGYSNTTPRNLLAAAFAVLRAVGKEMRGAMLLPTDDDNLNMLEGIAMFQELVGPLPPEEDNSQSPFLAP